MKYHDAQEAFKQGIVVVDSSHLARNPVVDDLCRRLIEASAEHHWDIDCQRDLDVWT